MFFPAPVIKEKIPDKKEKVKKISIFDFLKSITVNKNDLSKEPSFYKDYDVFMINRWLSMSSDIYAISIAMYLTTMDLDKLSHYKFLLNDFPKKYIKFSYKGKKKKYDKDVVNLLKLCYNISEKKVEELLKLELLSEEQINLLKKSYGGKKIGKGS